ncbi:MAG: prepilin-type N-terminal cleavage/methylation domain-containing protein [Candidatus Riflebacteria bacterium]|nr:prepilin-type N-terminal cleavage/methylation domain-containing protein [Candidatus Riflebacteria bacterium]
MSVDKKNGFTILELLLVLSLIAIVSAVSFPVFSNFVRQNFVSSAALSVVTGLEHARSRGLMDMLVPIATFTHGTGNYEIASKSFLLENDYRFSWSSGIDGSKKAFEFGTKGELLGYPDTQSLRIFAVQGGANVFIATTGMISWSAEN